MDAIIDSLRGTREPLIVAKLEAIVRQHGLLCRLISPLLRDGRWPRSFAAKYLHFHCPASGRGRARTLVGNANPGRRFFRTSIGKNADILGFAAPRRPGRNATSLHIKEGVEVATCTPPRPPYPDGSDKRII